MRYFTLVVWTYSLLVSNELLADWPQFMNDANNSGRTTSKLEPQALGLQRQIPLGEIILTSPAIVDDRAYVVDQMGDAYCVDIETGELVWKTVSHEKDPSGGNTCSPAVIDGKVIFGTTSGHLHFLDAKTGKSLKTFDLGWPVIGSVKATKETVYVPTVDSSVHAISLNGETRWKYDHYNLAKRWTDVYDKKADGKRFEQPHFGGAPVCVIERPEGNIVVAPCGYDLVALWDKGDSVEKLWSVNQPVTEFDHPSGVSAAGNTLYCAWPKSDGMGAVAKHSLEHGQAIAIVTDQWAILNPPANDNDAIVFNRHAFGTSEIQFLTKYPEKKASKQLQWQSFGITSASVNPAISATAITKEYAVATTLKGQLLVYKRNPKEEQAFRANKPLFKFQIPSGAMSTSAPAISNGKIVFGADDGCLYVIGPGESVEAKSVDLAANRELKLSDRYTEWPSAFGGDDNSGFVSNVNVKPPFRLRWAMKSYGLYKHPVCTANGELIYSSFSGIVVCRDQKTGKINWRRKLPGQAWSRATLLCADGKVFVPRLSSPRYAKIVDQEDLLYCLDQATGKLLWKNQIGRGDWLRASPVYANGVVAYGSKFETPRTSRYIVGPDQRWMIQVTDELAAAYQQTKFNSDYIRSEIANDGSIVAIRKSMKELPDQYELQARFTLELDLGANQEVGLVIGPNDKGYISITSPDQPRGRVIYDTDQGRVTPAVNSKYVGVAAKYVPIDMEFSAGKYALTMRIRKAKVKSNVSSSTSVFPPRLVVCEKGAAQGATIEAWDVNTGETRWVKTIDAKGSYIEGPSGCTDGELFYFTGGGAGENGRGMTMAIKPETGSVEWQNEKAFSCRTGTPAIAGDKLILSGALSRPLAALNLKSGDLLWENDSVTDLTMVHAPSIIGDKFTINTKYTGGSKCWMLEDGKPCMVDGEQLDVAGGAHTCGPIVMLGAGYAAATTNNGIYFTDVATGKIVHKTPGFASQTCPHPAVANGRLFYSPQNTGMLFCFEPKDGGK